MILSVNTDCMCDFLFFFRSVEMNQCTALSAVLTGFALINFHYYYLKNN